MYTLYYMPGACSRAIHALLNDLNVPVELIDKNKSADFEAINPAGQVPVLVDGEFVLKEGAAIILYLLEEHQSPMLPRAGQPRARFLQELMFANATLHPAYGRLFFIAKAVTDKPAQQEALTKAADMISSLWKLIDERLDHSRFVCGDSPSAVDFLLTVYANWGGMFPVDITLGANVERMIAEVNAYPAFQRAAQVEEERSAA